MRMVIMLLIGWGVLSAVRAEAPLLAKADFESGDLADWNFTDPEAWRIQPDGNSQVLALFQPSKYRAKVRSPYGVALLKRPAVGDFQLDLRFKSLTKNYNHRDLCLFFGYQDPEHFYYVHFGRNADPHSNSIFIVNGSPRTSIAKDRTKGTNWTDDWHRARIVRDTKTGKIEVYFDDMTKPAMMAEDTTFLTGQVGVGSFDDLGAFDDIELRGSPVEK
ncbi:hypothetical protein K2X85_13010 [bacterium]|nr:hypothetical protein [bacterium]